MPHLIHSSLDMTRSGRRWHRHAALLLAFFLVALSVGSSTFADEDPDGDPAPAPEDKYAVPLNDLQTPGNGRGIWQGALDSLQDDPAGLRLVLSRVLDPENDVLKTRQPNQRNPLLSYVMIHLLTRKADGGQILLARAIMDRLAALKDHRLAEQVYNELPQDPDTRIRPDWDRLMAYAEGILARKDHSETTADEAAHAMWLLSSVRTARSARAVGVLHEFAKRPEQELLSKIDEDVWIGAFDLLLGHAFESRRDAMAFLAAPARRQLLDKIKNARHVPDLWKYLFRLHDAARKLGTPDRANAIEDALGIVAAAETAADIEKYTDPDRRPYTEVRRAAWRRVEDLEPPATPEWVALLIAGLQREREQSVLSALLDVLGRAAFAKAEQTDGLADAIVARLDGENFVRADRLANRERLVKSLVGVGTITHFEEVLGVARKHMALGGDHRKLYEELIQKVGEVQGVTVATVAPHFFGNAKLDQPEPIRRAVAEVLGRRKIFEDETQSKIASALLRLLLLGENGAARDAALSSLEGVPSGENKIAAETRAPVRRALMESLSEMPTEANVGVLETLAKRPGKKGDDWAEERKHAVELLGKFLRDKSPATKSAARVLIRYVGASIKSPKRDAVLEIEAIKGLGNLHAQAGAQLASDVRAVIRNAINTTAEQGNGAAREAAVAAAIRLEDVKALDAVLQQVRASGHEKAWTDRLTGFVEALAKVGVDGKGERGKHDGAIVAFLERMTATAGEGEPAAKDWALALAIANKLVPEGSKRIAFVELSANLHAQRAAKPNGLSKEARQQIGREAYTRFIALGTLLGGSEGQDERRKRAYEKAYEVAVSLAGEMELGAPAWLDALSAAAKSGDTKLADRALADGGPATILNEIESELSEEQKSQRDTLKSQLDSLPRGS